MEGTNTINIFWTGGLDSTFRLIQCLTTTTNLVQPHYIVRSEDSTGTEIDTMIKIRREIVKKFPEVRSRFLQTFYTNEGIIHKYKDIDEEVGNLKKKGHTREQYHIMSNYCREYNIDQIDVSLIKLPGEEVETEFFKQFKNSKAFKSFRYPIIGYTKKELLRIAEKNNWNDILYLTSFCRRPVVNKIPCGLCGPCADAMSSGMGFRFPIKSWIKAIIQIPLRKYWRANYLKHNKGIFSIIKPKLERRF